MTTTIKTTDCIKNYLSTQTEPQDAATIAIGIAIPLSTVRKNLLRLKAEGIITVAKLGQVQVYSLPPQTVEPTPQGSVLLRLKAEGIITVAKLGQVQVYSLPPQTVEPTPQGSVAQDDESDDILINDTKATPRILIAKLRERAAKHLQRMQESASISPQASAKWNIKYKRAKSRLNTLEEQHPEVAAEIDREATSIPAHSLN